MFNQPPMTVRQGDVGLLRVSPPPRQGRQRKLGRTLAEGEVTGHSALVHPEHGALFLEKGTYQVIQQRETD